MRNIEVIKQFLNKSSGNSDSGNLISTGDRLFSYNTCIAEWLENNDCAVNLTKYSSTTSRHQNLLRRKIIYSSIQLVNVPINTQRLWDPKKM